MKSVPIRSAFSGIRTLRIQFKCGKMRTRISPNTDTFYACHKQPSKAILKRLSYCMVKFRKGKMKIVVKMESRN